MPIQVDHAERRNFLIEVAIDLIAEEGMDGASVRSIARRAGFSTVVVAHYFRNKAELLRQAFEHTVESTEKRIEPVIAAGADAAEALEILLPTVDASRKTWKIWFAFWGTALADPVYRQAQARRGREGKEIIRRVLDRCSDIPEDAAGGREMQSERLLALIGGIATIATFDYELWDAPRQRAILASELAALRAGF